MIDNEYNSLLILDNIAVLYWVQVESVHMKETTLPSVPWRGVSPTVT